MNQIKKGYKQTKVGVIPDDWEVVKLSEIFSKSFYGTSDSTNEIGKYPVLRMGNMQNGTLDLKDLVYIDLEEKEFKKYQLKKGDILLNRTNSYELVGKISLFELDGNYISASYIVAYRPNFKILNSIFINNLLNTTYFQEKIRTIATKGVSQANINPTSFKEVIKIPLPPLKEQEKIAEILTIWDEAISKQVELIKTKELQKKALMQKLLSGEVRFYGFNDEWKEIDIKFFLHEYNEKNTMLYPQYTIGKNGITLIAEQNYKINEHKIFKINDFIMGIGIDEINININFQNGCCSPIYNIFSIEENILNPYFGYYYLKKTLFKLKNKFCKKSTRRDYEIDNKEFKKLKIKLPTLQEQQKIVEVLSLADDEINLLKKELEELKLQKKALMQKLLTGETRVKV